MSGASSASRSAASRSAVHWGVQAAHGEVIVVMDGDLQHEPALIPKMLEALQAGHDIVSRLAFHGGRAAKRACPICAAVFRTTATG